VLTGSAGKTFSGPQSGMIVWDDPELTVRLWEGRNPLRMVIDREGKLPGNLKIFSGDTNTLVFTSNPKKDHGNTRYVSVPAGADYIAFILRHLYDMNILSLMVEGGAELISLFIHSGLWDEARVFTGNKRFTEGIPSPELKPDPVHQAVSGNDRLDTYRNR
jgi:diaminohydroxyphosphoribosylaminopyrimidine deaminase/5-amino-6-(5-phosphoribosylamino)uracil reductase